MSATWLFPEEKQTSHSFMTKLFCREPRAHVASRLTLPCNLGGRVTLSFDVHISKTWFLSP